MSLFVFTRPRHFVGLQNHPEAQDHTYKEAHNHLCEGMLAQDHAAAAHQSRNENDEAEPPDRVEGKEYRERYERTGEAS